MKKAMAEVAILAVIDSKDVIIYNDGEEVFLFKFSIFISLILGILLFMVLFVLNQLIIMILLDIFMKVKVLVLFLNMLNNYIKIL